MCAMFRAAISPQCLLSNHVALGAGWGLGGPTHHLPVLNRIAPRWFVINTELPLWILFFLVQKFENYWWVIMIFVRTVQGEGEY